MLYAEHYTEVAKPQDPKIEAVEISEVAATAEEDEVENKGDDDEKDQVDGKRQKPEWMAAVAAAVATLPAENDGQQTQERVNSARGTGNRHRRRSRRKPTR